MKRKQNPGPQIQARAARKYRPGLARKCGSLPPATGPQMQAISDTPSGPQMQAISRYTTPLPVSADASSVPSPSIAPSDGADLHRKPWTTPTVTEISFDDLPEELRLMALGLPVDGRAADDGTIPPWGDLPADLNPF
jgi:hypothetical protein